MFALMYDGFVQTARYATVAEVAEQYKVSVKNPLLYEYDCAAVELDSNDKILRILSIQELRN